MKIHKTGWNMLLFGMLLLVSGIILGSAAVEGLKDATGAISTEKVVVEVKPEWKGGDRKILTMEILKKLEKKLQNNLIAYTVEPKTSKQTIESNGSRTQVILAGIGGRYNMFRRFEFVYGGFSPAFSKSGAPKIALVSEDFAWERFKTHNAIGQTIQVYGESFVIAGVFRNGRGVLHLLTKEELPEVLIPAGTMLELDSGAIIASFETAADKSEIYNSGRNLILTALRQEGLDESRLDVSDFSVHQKLMLQKPMIIVFLTGFITIIFLGLQAFIGFKEIIRGIRSIYADYDLSNTLRAGIRTYGGEMIKTSVFLAFIFVVWRFSAFDFFILPEYVPGETPDMQKYADLLRESIRNTFSGVSDKASFSIRLLQATRMLTDMILCLSVFGGLIFTRIGTKLLRNQFINAGVSIWKAGGGLFLCLAVVLGLCYVSELPMSIYTKGILIVWIYIASGLQFGTDNLPSCPINEKGSVYIA